MSCAQGPEYLRTSHGIVIRTDLSEHHGRCVVPEDGIRETGLAFEATLWAFDQEGIIPYETVRTCASDFLYVCWLPPGTLGRFAGLQQGAFVWLELREPIYTSALVHEFAHYLVESECLLPECSSDPQHTWERVWNGAVPKGEQLWSVGASAYATDRGRYQ